MGTPNTYFIDQIIEVLAEKYNVEESTARYVTESAYESDHDRFYAGSIEGLAEELALTVDSDGRYGVP